MTLLNSHGNAKSAGGTFNFRDIGPRLPQLVRERLLRQPAKLAVILYFQPKADIPLLVPFFASLTALAAIPSNRP